MICAIHQPQYLPYLGFFHKVKNCDIFVLLDDAQFEKNEWQNRNRIRTKDGWQWLTVPVIHKFGQKINEVKINNTVNWRNKHLQAIITNYSKAINFKKYIDFFKETYKREWDKLVDINMHYIFFLLDAFNIKKKIIMASKLNIQTTGTQRLIDICKSVGADTYLSGIGGKEYLKEEKFLEKGIKLIYQEFTHPEYKQVYEPFIHNLSAIDFLLNSHSFVF